MDRAEGDFAHAGELIEESLARFQRLADKQGEAYALNALGNLARSSGDFERGRALLDRSLALRQEVGDRRGAGITLGCLAVLAAMSAEDDEPAKARRWLDRATRLFELLGSDAGTAYCRALETGWGTAAGSAIADSSA